MSAWQQLNPQLLKYFLAVARHGSLAAAAGSLHCVPSNVSARLRQLEQQLGVRLFERQSQGLRATAAGERLRVHAEQLESLCRQAWQCVQDDPDSGALCLGSMETTAAVRLPEPLAAFHRARPRVNLSLVTGHSQWLTAEVLAGRLDAALIAGPCEHPQLEAEELWRERLHLVLAASWPTARLQEAPLSLLGFAPGCQYRSRLERWAEQTGVAVAARPSFGSVDAILAGIAAGMGVSLLPASLLAQHPRGRLVRCEALPEALAAAPTLLVRRRGAAVPPPLQHLLTLLRAPLAQAG
ncbi:LysR family transcriptional regulator [Pseudomonas sp. CrR25]|nr:LysR family transcriptional regulator [Pseudomonas sp. CrR25]